MPEKKQVIYKAAVKLFARDGYYATTTDKIAREAEVAVGTVYNYFENKKDILDYIFLREFNKRKEFYQSLQIDENLSSLDKINLLVEKHLQETAHNPLITKIILEERLTAGRCPTAFQEGLPLFLKEIFSQGMTQKSLCQCDSRLAALFVFGCLEAVMAEFVRLWQESEEEGQDFIANAIEELKRVIKRVFTG